MTFGQNGSFIGFSSEGVREPLRLGNCSFDQLLMSAQLVRNKEAVIDDCKNACLLFAKHQNDKGCCHALSILSQEIETESLFAWLDSVYWTLPLYLPGDWEEKTNCTYHYVQWNGLGAFKKKVIQFVAGVWLERHLPWGSEPDHALSEKAWKFLCDCFDSDRFVKRAPALDKGIRDFKARHREYGHGGICIPKEEKDQILLTLREAISPTSKRNMLYVEKKLNSEESMPLEIYQVLAHAAIKAGAKVVMQE